MQMSVTKITQRPSDAPRGAEIQSRAETQRTISCAVIAPA